MLLCCTLIDINFIIPFLKRSFLYMFGQCYDIQQSVSLYASVNNTPQICGTNSWFLDLIG